MGQRGIDSDAELMLDILFREEGVVKKYVITMALREWFRLHKKYIYDKVLSQITPANTGLGITGDVKGESYTEEEK